MALRDDGLSVVRVRKGELLLRLRENRGKHAHEADAAAVAFLARLAADSRSLVAAYEASDEREVRRLFEGIKAITTPQTYLQDYDRVIGMLAMSVSDEVEITEEQYRHFVLDEWEWSRHFKTINASYGARR